MEYVILVLLIMTVAVVSVAAYVYYHPQIIIDKIQDLLYKGKPINSYEPFGKPEKKIKENGQLYITEIKYGTEYPNSYLDISYPNEDTTVVRPTVIYFHGGGFFGGDKAMGDPMAANDDANRLLNEVVDKGFNLVNVNYALVPDCHFPIPLIQMEQAIAFLKKNAELYGLDMTNVVIFGQSAGAILAGQYGSLMVNEEYRKILGITPSLEKDELSALIIDDAPFIISNFGLKLKLMLGNYMGTMNMKSDVVKKHNAYEYIKEGSQDPSHYGEKQSPTRWGWSDAKRSWNYRGFEGKPIIVEVYSNADEVELFRNGESLGKKKPQKCKAYFDITYEPGEIYAVSYKDSQKTGEDKLLTASYEVSVKTEYLGDGITEISLVDENGILNPDADVQLEIPEEYMADIIGFGSADPKSEENYFDRVIKTYNGRALVISGGDRLPKIEVKTNGIYKN